MGPGCRTHPTKNSERLARGHERRRPPRPASLAHEARGDELADAIERHALLRGRVPVAQGHGLVRERLAVDGDAEGRADLVHARVALADRLLRVVLASEAGAKLHVEL